MPPKKKLLFSANKNLADFHESRIYKMEDKASSITIHKCLLFRNKMNLLSC